MIILYITAMVMILREEAKRIIWSYTGNDMLSHFWVSFLDLVEQLLSHFWTAVFEAIERSG